MQTEKVGCACTCKASVPLGTHRKQWYLLKYSILKVLEEREILRNKLMQEFPRKAVLLPSRTLTHQMHCLYNQREQ